MSNFDSIDFFTDQSLVPDPHPYFDYLRSQNPVMRLPHYNVVAITGWEEANAVYKDPETFSNIVALGGPFPPLPFEVDGDDLGPLIDAHRSQFPMFEHMVTMDPPDHTRARSILSRLLTPSRLKENEEFMWQLADRQLDEFLGERRVRIHRRILQALCDVGDRRPARCSGRGPQGVPLGAGRGSSRRAGGVARSRIGGHQSAGVAR